MAELRAESKQGVKELQKRTHQLSTKQSADMFNLLVGWYSRESTEEWESFRRAVEYLLPEMER